jgi:hypothetical protein
MKFLSLILFCLNTSLLCMLNFRWEKMLFFMENTVCKLSGRPIDIVYKNSSGSTLIFVEVDLMSTQILSCKEHAF